MMIFRPQGFLPPVGEHEDPPKDPDGAKGKGAAA
jgi:hypothetical protein